MRTGTTQRGSREFDELAPYLKAVRDFPPLSREEEHAAAVRARRGETAGQAEAGAPQPGLRGGHRPQAAARHGPARRPHPGGERRPDARRGEVRSRRRDPLLDLRGLVDPRLRRQVPQGGPQHGPAAERHRGPARHVAGQRRRRGRRDHPPRADRGRRAGARGRSTCRPRATATSAMRSARSASGSASWAGTSSTTGSSRTSPGRWRRSASAGASRASGSGRWS